MQISTSTLICSWLIPVIFLWFGIDIYQTASGLELTISQAKYCLEATDSHWAFGNSAFSCIACFILSSKKYRTKEKSLVISGYFFSLALITGISFPFNLIVISASLWLYRDAGGFSEPRQENA